MTIRIVLGQISTWYLFKKLFAPGFSQTSTSHVLCVLLIDL